jgi:transcriptional regulator with XRE-family HTH domain
MTDEEIQAVISELGAEMKEAREQRAVTQREQAALMNTNQGQVHLLESGRANPTIASILRFYDALGMDVVVVGLKRKKI